MPDFIKPEYMNQNVFDKLIKCSTSDVLKLKVLEICAREKDETAVEKAFNSFFTEEHQLKGKTVKLKDNETLGHIKDFDGLLNHLVKKTRFKRRRLKQIFTAFCLDDSGQMQAHIDSFFKALEKKPFNVSSENTWLFRSEIVDTSPFKVKNPECLPARLALPSYDEGVSDFIGFEIERRHLVAVKQPRISDAGYDFAKKYWFSGGKTKPLLHRDCDVCKKQPGLDEVISRPVLFKIIKRKTIRIRT